MLIGLCGLPSNGKDTIALYLAKRHGFQVGRMASGLKNMLRELLRHSGVETSVIEQMIEGSLKEVPSPYLAGKTPRWAMQTLGTEWGRACLGENIWGDIWERYTSAAIDNGKSVVCTDIRFENEQERVKRLGGFIVLVNGRNGMASGHTSDRMDWLVPDYTIENNGTMKELETKVDQLVQRIREDVWK